LSVEALTYITSTTYLTTYVAPMEVEWKQSA